MNRTRKAGVFSGQPIDCDSVNRFLLVRCRSFFIAISIAFYSEPDIIRTCSGPLAGALGRF